MVRCNIYVAMHNPLPYIDIKRKAADAAQVWIEPEGMTIMTEAINTGTAKAKTKPAAAFEAPKFEIPNFELPKLEVPAAFREFAEKSVSQAKDNWEKVKAVTEEATDLLETSYATAAKGGTDYGLKLIDVSRANADAAFDFASQLLTAKSLSEVIELSTAHARKQFDAAAAQTKELTALAQKIAAETTEPIKNGVTNAFKKVA